MRVDKSTEKYLAHYAEPLSQVISVAHFPNRHSYHHCVVIPCFSESTAFIRRLFSTPLNSTGKILVIIVLNQPEGLPRINRLNARMIQYLHEQCTAQPIHQQATLFTKDIAVDVLLINVCASGIPRKQGVGLARKIGCDIAVRLFSIGVVACEWLHCTDADASLPRDYFKMPATNAVAATYEFQHRFLKASLSKTEQALEAASQHYENRLRYYQLGLRYAGSPYAFFTIGSAIAFRISAYCKVRGFPKRAAGEDFYLLNKLAKLGHVTHIDCTITLQPRASSRVPFGTGPATLNLLSNEQRVDYSPEVFVELKRWLDQLPTSCDIYLRSQHSYYGDLSPTAQQALAAIGIKEFWQHLSRQKLSLAQAVQSAHQWFDGFRTLKFIHHLTHTHFHKVSAEDIQLSPLPFATPYQ